MMPRAQRSSSEISGPPASVGALVSAGAPVSGGSCRRPKVQAAARVAVSVRARAAAPHRRPRMPRIFRTLPRMPPAPP